MSFTDAIEHVRENGASPPETKHYIGGVHLNEYRIKAGMALISERHMHNHANILASGSAILRTPKGDKTITGPLVVEQESGVEYALLTITDVVWFCIQRGHGVG